MEMKHILTIISCFAVLSLSAQSPCTDCFPCTSGAPCCQDENACNFGETYCFTNTGCPDYWEENNGCVYHPVFLDCNETCWNDSDEDGICDELEISGCDDELACNYDVTATDSDESCVFPTCLDSLALNYDPTGGCEGDCIYGCASIGDPSWISLNEGIHPAENSVVQGMQAELEFVLNIPGTVQDGATGTPYAVSQFVIEEVTGWPSWADAIEMEGDTLEVLEQICVPISGIPVSEGTYELSILGTYTVLIFDLPFEIGAVEYSAFIHVEANPDPVEGCTYELAVNFLPYATLDDGSCEFEGCADQTALNYIPYGNSFDFCVYAESVCGIGLVWDDLLQTCVPSEEFVEALQIIACGEGTYWNEELGICLPIDSCPEDLNGDGVVGVEDLLTLLSSFGTPCDPPVAEWTCGDPVSYHGYDYGTVLIGEQCWFAENLRTELYQNGDTILIDLIEDEWASSADGAQCVYGEDGIGCESLSPEIDACNSAESLAEYGRLYNWYAVDDIANLCPESWYVPSDDEWTAMANFLGGRLVAGMKIKETHGWVDDGVGDNSSGFSGLPAGGRSSNGANFWGAGNTSYWWTSTAADTSDAWFQDLNAAYPALGHASNSKNLGFSVRCIKD